MDKSSTVETEDLESCRWGKMYMEPTLPIYLKVQFQASIILLQNKLCIKFIVHCFVISHLFAKLLSKEFHH